MRWDALFADLEGQLAAEAEAERRWEIADRSTAERARLRLIDRIRPLLDEPAGALQVAVVGHDPISGRVSALGVDWVLLQLGNGQEVLVALRAVSWIRGLGERSAEPGWEGAVGARLRLPAALRQLLRHPGVLAVDLVGGPTLVGRLIRVGADHLELAERGGASQAPARVCTLPLTALAMLRPQRGEGSARR